MECETVVAAAASPKRVRAPRKPKAAADEAPVAELVPPGLEPEPSSSDQPQAPRARSRTPRAPRAKAAAAAPEPEPEMTPPPKRTRVPRKPKVAAAEATEPVDQMQVLLPVVDGAFLATLSGTLKTLRKKTRAEKISALPIA